MKNLCCRLSRLLSWLNYITIYQEKQFTRAKNRLDNRKTTSTKQKKIWPPAGGQGVKKNPVKKRLWNLCQQMGGRLQNKNFFVCALTERMSWGGVANFYPSPLTYISSKRAENCRRVSYNIALKDSQRKYSNSKSCSRTNLRSGRVSPIPLYLYYKLTVALCVKTTVIGETMVYLTSYLKNGLEFEYFLWNSSKPTIILGPEHLRWWFGRCIC